MFEKWDLPKNLCELFVIDRTNLELFVGREKKAEKLITLLQGNNVALVEGVFGCGKTSFGNYCRFKTNQFTPTEEIKTDPNFTLDSFLQCLISSVLQEIHLKNSPYSHLSEVKDLEPFFRKYEDLYVNTKSGGVNASLPLIGGAGLSVSKTISYSRAPQNSVQLLSDFKHLIGLIQSELKNTNPIIFQLNNLDLGHGFTEEQMISFFNLTRDIFGTPNTAWVITGKIGIGELIRTKIPKMHDFIKTHIKLDDFSLEEVKEVFRRRTFFEGFGGVLPIEDDLLNKIYHSTSGSFRKTLKMVYRILTNFSRTPGKKEIFETEVRALFSEEYSETIVKLKKLNMI